MSTSGIPYANARLLSIAASGGAADYDNPAGAGTSRWTGNIGIYLDDSRQQVLTPTRVDEDRRTRVEIPWNVGKFVQQGDVLTYTFNPPHPNAGNNETGIADDLQGDALVGRQRIRFKDR